MLTCILDLILCAVLGLILVISCGLFRLLGLLLLNRHLLVNLQPGLLLQTLFAPVLQPLADSGGTRHSCRAPLSTATISPCQNYKHSTLGGNASLLNARQAECSGFFMR